MYRDIWPPRVVLLGMAVLLGAVFSLAGCGGGAGDPLSDLSRTLRGMPTYSIVLDDMREEGNFFKNYYHQYRIVTPEKSITSGWRKVSKDFYNRYLPFLGMTIYVKKDGQETANMGPPGYEYVGDSRYGRWRQDSSGRSFWEFYGQYAFMASLLGSRPIYRDSYTTYRTHWSSGRPYYGPQREYGTNGSVTKQKKPDFYSRRMSAVGKSKTSFGNKVNQRIGRSKTSIRSRSRSVGK